MYGKLFASLYQGTLRGKAHEILVFTNLIAHADRYGYVDKHFNAIAQEVGLSREEVEAAIKNLEAPDPESRSVDLHGSRLERIDAHRAWGWRIVNHGKYRAIRNIEDRREQNRIAQAAYREKNKPPSAHADAEAEAQAEANTYSPSLTRGTKESLPKEWPNLETVLRFAATNGILQDCAEKWWLSCDGRGGSDANGQAITNWPSALLGFWVGWRGNIQSRKQGAPTSPLQDSKVYWELKSKYDMVCSEIKAIEDRAPTDAMHNMHFSEPDKTNRVKLIGQRKQLRKQLGLT